jgi:hypothetical protein
MPDVIEGIKQALLADSTVSSITSNNVYDLELPLQMDPSMPTRAIVIRGAGGPGGPATLQIVESRLNLMCWGETPHLAHTVYNAVYAVLKGMLPSVWANTYIHGCILAAGEIPFRDPDEQWPYSMSSWLVRSSDLTPP